MVSRCAGTALGRPSGSLIEKILFFLPLSLLRLCSDSVSGFLPPWIGSSVLKDTAVSSPLNPAATSGELHDAMDRNSVQRLCPVQAKVEPGALLVGALFQNKLSIDVMFFKPACFFQKFLMTMTVSPQSVSPSHVSGYQIHAVNCVL